MDDQITSKVTTLLDRLERISADSPWAHQASGIRSSLAKGLSRGHLTPEEIKVLVLKGYRILEKAASEIPNHDGAGE